MRTLHDVLKEKRKEKNLSLEDISKEIKIKLVYLKAIEEGRYHDLPSESYARGFVKNYAEFLGIPESKSGPLFRREYKAEKVDFVPGFRKTQHRYQKKSLLSPRSLLIFGAVAIILAFIGYQYSSLFISPELIISQPQQGTIISDNVIQIEGETDPYATVLVDNEEVYVGLDGKFRKSMYAFPGEKKITVVSRNRFGKESKEVITVKVK